MPAAPVAPPAPAPRAPAPPPAFTARPQPAAPSFAPPQPAPAPPPITQVRPAAPRPVAPQAPVAQQPPMRMQAPLAAPAAPARPVAAAPTAPPAPIHTAPPARTSVPVPRASTAIPGQRAPINPFLANDPNQKAKRLARALVSDIVAYFPEKHQEGLRDGTLRELFREEIKKSYEEYVDQMGKDFSEGTTHFQDALNDVLAQGHKVF
jgi:hypothetical protein